MNLEEAKGLVIATAYETVVVAAMILSVGLLSTFSKYLIEFGFLPKYDGQLFHYVHLAVTFATMATLGIRGVIRLWTKDRFWKEDRLWEDE